jgi:hypothetical protein
MTRSDLQPLPKESEKRIELVTARHEVKIRKAFRNWRREKGAPRPPSLTAQQQSDLQALLVARSVELGETEGRERLSATPCPRQFENEVHSLVEIVADEARDRWKSWTSGFHIEASPDGVYADAERGVHSRVRELLSDSCEDLITEAWSAHEKRLEAECGGDLAPLRAAPEADTGTGPAESDLRVPGGRAETPRGRRANRLRIDKRVAIENCADVGDSAGKVQRSAVPNTAVLEVKSDTATQERTKQRHGKDRKGDASLLAEHFAVAFRTAELYLGISERHRQNLMKSGDLKVDGLGHNRKITTESLRKCLRPKAPN